MSDPNNMNKLAMSVTEQSSKSVMKYPLSLGDMNGDSQNFILFHAKPYSRKNTKVNGNDTSDIALYIPPGSMKTKFTGNYTPLTGGALFENEGFNMAAGMTGAALGSLLAPKFKGAAAVVGVLAGLGIKGIMEGLGRESNKAGSFLEGIVTGEGESKLLEEAKQFTGNVGALAIANFGGALAPISAMAGIGINPHIAMTYQGPGAFRTHDMSFDFWPRDYQEASMVKNIIKTFKKRMVPKMNGFAGMQSVYFNFPHEFYIDYYIGGPTGAIRFDQMGIRRSVLTSMYIKFDASAQGPGFYTETNMGYKQPLPIHTKMQLVFQETEFILNNLDTGKTSDQSASTETPGVYVDNSGADYSNQGTIDQFGL